MPHHRSRAMLLLAVLGVSVSGALTGCQTDIAGQTLPSAYYLQDDVQYFPAGPEMYLSNQVQQMEEYRFRQAGLSDDPADDLP